MIPRDEIVMLRDWLYESDRITMGGIADINKLLKKYEVSPVVRCKDCIHQALKGWCCLHDVCMCGNKYCSEGVRREDGKNSMDG